MICIQDVTAQTLRPNISLSSWLNVLLNSYKLAQIDLCLTIHAAWVFLLDIVLSVLQCRFWFLLTPE